jgi:hypothetical protein
VARKPAQSHLGFHFLLMFSANGKTVFGTDDDRRKLNEIVAGIVTELGVRLHAYCWLSNEIEVVAETGAVAPERLIRKIATTYSSAVGSRLGRNGVLFSDTHVSYEPETQSELVDIVRAMHVRPVVLDLSEDSLSFPWSSARAYASSEATAPGSANTGPEVKGEEVAWLTQEVLAPLLQRGESPTVASETESKAQTAPGMIAEAVEAKLSRETEDRARVWMARALIGWIVTRDGLADLEQAARRLGVDATALKRSIDKYRLVAPDLFETPLAAVMNWREFEVASPKVRKDIADILATLGQWQH